MIHPKPYSTVVPYRSHLYAVVYLVQPSSVSDCKPCKKSTPHNTKAHHTDRLLSDDDGFSCHVGSIAKVQQTIWLLSTSEKWLHAKWRFCRQARHQDWWQTSKWCSSCLPPQHLAPRNKSITSFDTAIGFMKKFMSTWKRRRVQLYKQKTCLPW